MNKVELRKHFRLLRQGIDPDTKAKSEAALAQRFLQSSLYKNAKKIACYMAFKDELNIFSIITRIWDDKKSCYIPILITKDDKIQLFFAEFKPEDALHTNRFGILEPSPQAERIAIKDLDVILTPMIAFDRDFNRLGTGGGYYDKTFAVEKDPPLIGVAYALQEADQLPTDPWDKKLKGILTEKELILNNQRS